MSLFFKVFITSSRVRVAGGAEGVEEAGGEIDFAGEEAAAYGYTASLRENKQAHFPLSFRSSRGFLTFGDVALARHSEQAPSALALCNVATAIKIGHGNLLSVTLLHFGNAQRSLALRSTSATVLLELVHNNENLNETIGPKAGIRIKERFILCIKSPARP